MTNIPISEDMKRACCFGQKGKMCNVVSFINTSSCDGYFLKEIPFSDYLQYARVCKFSDLDFVTDIIELNTIVMIIDRIEKLEQAMNSGFPAWVWSHIKHEPRVSSDIDRSFYGKDSGFSALGGCIIRREPAVFSKIPTKRVIIAGGRTIKDYGIVESAIKNCGFCIGEVVSGGAPGVDMLGEEWARLNDKKVITFKADWDNYGNSAGPIRNKEMAKYADCLIAIWDGKSKSTQNMITQMYDLGKKVYIHRIYP